MSDWKKVGENLVRHKSGTIYLRGRVGGKPIRVSLDTDNLKIAKIARDAKLEQLRKAAKAIETTGTRTIGAALDAVESRTMQSHLKESSRKFYRDVLRLLRSSLPLQMKAGEWTAEKASEWWTGFCEGKSPGRANQCLSTVKKMGAVIVESGNAQENPAARLKRLHVPRSRKVIPKMEDVEKIIENIRSQKLRHSEESANFAAFLAYTGMRVAEANSVKWGDITDDWVVITGGKNLTKNRETRHLPINILLRNLLDHMRKAHDGNPDPDLKLFDINSPYQALEGAAIRLGINHVHPHLLRHHFTTWAIESGVDIPSIAEWLGHKDGGALLMKTYSHLRAKHSLRMAGLLTMSAEK